MTSSSGERTHYEILHVLPDAPDAVLKSSYRALMKSLDMHPDRGGDHLNATLVNEAYAVLSDPVRRTAYDRTLAFAAPPDPDPEPRSDAGGPHDRAQATPTDHEVVTPNRPAPRFETGPAPNMRTFQCLFCGTPRTITGPARAEPACLTCKSPLTLAEAPQLADSGRRTARRIARDGALTYHVDWRQREPFAGRIADLSPAGLQFVADAPIEISQIIKLDSPLFGAVGRVASCRPHGRSFAIGVEFYTSRFHQSRGTFVSTTA